MLLVLSGGEILRLHHGPRDLPSGECASSVSRRRCAMAGAMDIMGGAVNWSMSILTVLGRFVRILLGPDLNKP